MLTSKDINVLVDFDVRGQQEMDFPTGGSIIMDYGLHGLWYFGQEW